MQPDRTRRPSGHVSLRQRARGPVFYVKYRQPDGRQVQRLLGPAWTKRGRPPAGQWTRAMAEAELQRLLAEAERGPAAGAGATFADAAEEFLRFVEHARHREGSTVADYRGVVRGYLLNDDRMRALGLEPLSGRPLADVSPDDVERYKDRLLDEGRLSNRTVVRHLTVLHGIFKRAARVWGLERNPASADLVERPPVRYSGEFQTLDADELAALARHAADGQDAALFLTAAYTGLRQGELLALRWRDVDFALGRFHVRHSLAGGAEKAPKSGRVRSVPMVPDLVPVLDGLSRREHFAGDDDLVFCDQVGGHLCSWALRRRFYAALERAGLRRIRFHDLRHCFGSTAVQAFALSDVQAMLGHAHITTTMRYVHHQPGLDDGERLAAAFRGRDRVDFGAPTTSPAAP